MQEFKIFIITFIVVYLIYLVTVILRNKKKNRFEESVEIRYLEKVYKINVKRLNMKSLSHTIALSNSFIISLTLSIISFVELFILKMLVGFVVLIILELLIYHIIGKYYQGKKRGDNDV